MYQFVTIVLLAILITIIAYEYSKMSEGFDDIVQDNSEPSQPSQQPDCLVAAAKALSEETAIAKKKQEQAELLRDIRTVVHNELISAQASTTASAQPHLSQSTQDGTLLYYDTPSTAQGTELKGARPKWCPRDMSEYIRKDSIPCWNCSL